jgi:hypothetical protein
MESVETTRKKGFFKRVREGVGKALEELKEDSVASNPRKPVDCCNPPIPPRIDHKLKK